MTAAELEKRISRKQVAELLKDKLGISYRNKTNPSLDLVGNCCVDFRVKEGSMKVRL